MLTTNPPRRAFQKTGEAIFSPTPNPLPITLVSQKRKELIISEKSPRVMRSRGKVKNLISLLSLLKREN